MWILVNIPFLFLTVESNIAALKMCTTNHGLMSEPGNASVHQVRVPLQPVLPEDTAAGGEYSSPNTPKLNTEQNPIVVLLLWLLLYVCSFEASGDRY